MVCKFSTTVCVRASDGVCGRRVHERACVAVWSVSAALSMSGACLRRCRCLERACGAFNVWSVPATLSLSGACLRRCVRRIVPCCRCLKRTDLRRCTCLERACGAVERACLRNVERACGAVRGVIFECDCAVWSVPAALLGTCCLSVPAALSELARRARGAVERARGVCLQLWYARGGQVLVPRYGS